MCVQYKKEIPKLHHALKHQTRSKLFIIVQTCLQNVEKRFNAQCECTIPKTKSEIASCSATPNKLKHILTCLYFRMMKQEFMLHTKKKIRNCIMFFNKKQFKHVLTCLHTNYLIQIDI